MCVLLQSAGPGLEASIEGSWPQQCIVGGGVGWRFSLALSGMWDDPVVQTKLSILRCALTRC